MKLNFAFSSLIIAVSTIGESSGFSHQVRSNQFGSRHLVSSKKLSATVAPTSGDDVDTASGSNPAQSVFLTPASAKACIDAVGSPLYAYSKEALSNAADECLAFPNAYGLTVRYAMKASPNKSILQLFSKKGIHIDASSGYEVCNKIINPIL